MADFASQSEIRREKSNQQIFAELLRAFALRSRGNPRALLKSLSTFQTILANVVKSPEAAKFRLLRRGNKALEGKIFRHVELLQTLELLGFQPLSAAQFCAQCPQTSLQPAERNLFLSDAHLNVGSVDNVLEVVREAKAEVADAVEALPEEPPRPVPETLEPEGSG